MFGRRDVRLGRLKFLWLYLKLADVFEIMDGNETHLPPTGGPTADLKLKGFSVRTVIVVIPLATTFNWATTAKQTNKQQNM